MDFSEHGNHQYNIMEQCYEEKIFFVCHSNMRVKFLSTG